MNEDRIQSKIAKGAQAEATLRHEPLSEAFKALETRYITAWAQTQPDDTNGRENLWRATQILGDVRRHLVSTMQDGKIAQKELDDLVLKGRPRAA